MESGVAAGSRGPFGVVVFEAFAVGRPNGPCSIIGTVDDCLCGAGWVLRGVTVEVLRVDVDGVLMGLGRTRLGIAGGGRRYSE